VKTSEIRTSFLKYFEQNGHTIVASSNLVPADDPTLLFANSGMVQFKDTFLGVEKRPYVRATTCQKSLRISGKHNDLENVGRTARHHTFFEMLGNFSFGDYFKKDAIHFGWEFLTKVLALPKERLWVTIFEEDDEAEKLWSELTDLLPGRILRCGREDNFWQMGETGPCGPCSEIHYFLGEGEQSEAEFRKGDGTYIEIWNLVFMQFNRDLSGNLTPLPKPSVDTGMGLERIAAVKQGVKANYDTDLLRDIIRFTEKLSNKSYLGADYKERDPLSDRQYAFDIAHRVICDHSRAATFLVADGVMPGSDGRGFVLRRLIRRACRHGRELGFREPFLHQVSEEVVRLMGEAYPELQANREKITKLIRLEEEKFLRTLDEGLDILGKNIEVVKAKGGRALSGEIAFLLHDTYGFPLDLTQDIVRLSELSVDIRGFEEKMSAQRERARHARASSAELLLQRAVRPQPTKFVGYEFLEFESPVKALFKESGEVAAAREGDEVVVLCEETPFYAESGGQVGDTGTLTSNSATLEIVDTQKVGGDCFAHIARVIEGELEKGQRVRLKVDEMRRKQLAVNHSATHLLHLALQEILGDHVKQAGSRVSPNEFRFDFNHYEAIPADVLWEIEQRINHELRVDYPVVTEVMELEQAKSTGAKALFGEKYSDKVRVVSIGPRSRELCGGTHVGRSGELGFVSILSEGAISAGVRRVEAVAGEAALQRHHLERQTIKSVASLVNSSDAELVHRVEKMLERSRELEKLLQKYEQSSRSALGASVAESAKDLPGGGKLVAKILEGIEAKVLRELADDVRNRIKSGCVALGSVVDGKAILLTAVTPDLVGRYHAGELLKELSPVLGSKGGGRADLAQAGGGMPEKLPEALRMFEELTHRDR
jgi:alanyl-tRNA synthetase